MVLLITVNISITQLSLRKPFSVLRLLITVNVAQDAWMISFDYSWRFQLHPFVGKYRFTGYSERSSQSTKQALLITVNVLLSVITFTDYSECFLDLADLTY